MVLWFPWRRKRLADAAERFKREHSMWLTKAMLSGREYPKIPTRPVERGGYDAMRTRPGGQNRAAQWWTGALSRVDEV